MKTIALVGCPNTGKTSIFNALTGSRQKVANYAGVTVEKREGLLRGSADPLRLIDLPGVRGLVARSRDEEITWEILRGSHGESVSHILAVVDATELERTLPLVVELARLGLPMTVAVNMMDLAVARGLVIDLEAFARELGVPVISCSAVTGRGIKELGQALSVEPGGVSSQQPALGIEAASARAATVLSAAIKSPLRPPTRTDRIDGILLHRWLGPLIGLAVMFVVFQAVFTVAAPFQDGIEYGISLLSGAISSTLGDGPLKDLIVDGAIAGVGAVIVFLPQILLLFLMVSILEDSGYLARAAFLLDRSMRAVGLSGQAFLPLLSSFACAIPGIMATRTIENARDRRLAILTAPLMACSARLPVYTLLIAAFIPDQTFAPLVGLQGLVMFGLYLTGIIGAFAIAWVSKMFGSSKDQSLFLLELPTYKRPSLRNLGLGLWQRSSLFIKRAGTTIFGLSVLLWFLVSYPKGPDGQSSLEHSMAGRIGAVIAPVLAPIGFDWKISMALVPGLAAREVMVGALATVYAVSDKDEDRQTESLARSLPSHFSLATALSLLMWYVFAPQCLATFAVTRRETGSLRFAGYSVLLYFAMAYVTAFVTYRLALGLGAGA